MSLRTRFEPGWAVRTLVAFALTGLAAAASAADRQTPAQSAASQGYVGSDTCATCHEDEAKYYQQTAHAKLTNVPGWTVRDQGCESCHGPGKAHVDAGGDPNLIRRFTGAAPRDVSETCLRCHAGSDERNNFRRGGHGRADVSCINCHAPHSPASASPHMVRAEQPALCYQCHAEVRAQFSMAFHHRVGEGAMVCTDCHNPHGGFEPRQARLSVGADVPCLKCHADKQGPFVFEHAPLKIEGCAVCHQPHGSNNPRLLVRSQIRQLCLECHTNVGTIGAPNTPSFHNQASVTYQNCTLCHAKIHGSNLDPTFFR